MAAAVAVKERSWAVLLGWMLAVATVAPAVAQGTVFQPQDKTPTENPCDKEKVPDDVYATFKTLLSQVLGDEAGVVKDIDQQVKDKAPDDKEKPVSVEIHVVTEEEFKREYADDVDGLPGNEKKTKAELEKEAEGLFNGLAAFTYTSDKISTNGTQVIKVKIFCKESFRTMTIDEAPMRELIIHELVHAKLYAIGLLGGTEPFSDHDGDSGNDEEEPFHKEVKRLVELMKKNLQLAYAPGTGFSSDALASVLRCDTGQEVPMNGMGQAALGPLVDQDGDGLKDVEVRITSLQMTSVDGALGIQQSPQTPSLGMIEEQAAGEPFPASSFVDLFVDIYFEGEPTGQSQSRVQADIGRVPPFGHEYRNSQPQCPSQRQAASAARPTAVAVLLLTFVALDTDGDGMDNLIDPDDDNDGLPDVEDPHPLVPSGECTVIGSGKGEKIHGTDEADVICGDKGNDALFGEAGWDELFGEKGRDRIRGGPGDDRLFGDESPDRLLDKTGDDVLIGGQGEDSLTARDGKPGDRLSGGPGEDTCKADRGDIVRSC